MRAGGPIPVCDFMTGLLGAFGVLLALLQRKDGIQSTPSIDVALYDGSLPNGGASNFLSRSHRQCLAKSGNHSLGGAPTGHFQTSDEKWVCLSVQNDAQCARCAELVGRPEWIDDPNFKTLAGRTAHRDEIEACVATWIGQRKRTAVLAAFEARSLGVGPIQSIEDMADEEHFNIRDLQKVDDPVLGNVRMPGTLPALPNSPNTHNPAPALGEPLTKF